jgi:lipopolysaccharide transport system ATP-binding protein
MSTVIQISHLSKTYRLGEIGTGTISRDLERWFKMKIKGQEDPFLKIGETNDRSIKGKSDIVYSLKDINLEVQQGEALGIIGRNGAGKSTLLKIISRVTSPTTGRIKIKGRIASLLEVGTGFHPELTGRENIYLNGAILGMRKKEITRNLDEIIDFSGVERYIDTPVKRYSSGMYVRLAFAVAAHLESEILIVDEVLAVGDAEFQTKCLGKMGEVSKGKGRTVLFVSHNMGSVSKLCTQGILIEDGKITTKKPIVQIIKEYSNNQNIRNKSVDQMKRIHPVSFRVRISNFLVTSMNQVNPLSIDSLESVSFNYEINAKEDLTAAVTLQIKNTYQTILYFDTKRIQNRLMEFKKGINNLELDVDPTFLSDGTYSIDISIGANGEVMDYISDVYTFIVKNDNANVSEGISVYSVNHRWNVQ